MRLIEIFLVDLIELIIEIISQFLTWIGLEVGRLSKDLIAIELSVRIVIIELIGITRRREIIADSSAREESGEGVIAALNLIERLFLQIHPMLVCMFVV